MQIGLSVQQFTEDEKYPNIPASEMRKQLQTRPVESVRSYTYTLVVVFQREGSNKY